MEASVTEMNPGSPRTFLRVRPLGGAGTMGANCTVYQCGDTALVVDCGIGYPTAAHPGVDALLPDLDAVEALGPQLAAYVVTHGHDDHIGALPYALRRSPAPVLAPPYAAQLIEEKLLRAGFDPVPPVRRITPASRASFGPFSLRFVRVAHSMPDCLAVVLEGPWGRVVHTGDWKVDTGPADGFSFDEAAFDSLGRAGVDLLLSDSTNALAGGWTRSETAVGEALEACIDPWSGRVVVATFASNTHRIVALARIAEATGRRLSVLGRAMERHLAAARSLGYAVPPPSALLPASALPGAPPRSVLVVCTGSQAEPGSALAEAARGAHPWLQLGPGDRVILSARPIPGNERAVHDVVDELLRRGVDVVAPPARAVHASGHAHVEELTLLIEALRPRAFVPIHGNRAMLEAHAALARRAGVPEVCIVENGESVELTRGGLRRGPTRTVNPWVVDGDAVLRVDDPAVTQRRRIARHGVVIVEAHLDGARGALAALRIVPVGVHVPVQARDAAVVEVLETAKGVEDPWSEETLGRLVARALARRTGKRPVVVVTFVPAGASHPAGADASKAAQG